MFGRIKSTYDFFESESKPYFSLEEVVENFICSFTDGYFARWEAVVAQEEGKTLTEYQQNQLSRLMNFGNTNDEILYINGMPRPSKPWYEIAQDIAPRIVEGKIKPYEMYSCLVDEGWDRMKAAMTTYGPNLSKPAGIENAIEVIPTKIRHQLEIQTAISWLIGLGQAKDMTLSNASEEYRLEELVKKLQESIESVRYFQLSIAKILEEFIELPPQDEIFFKAKMMEMLGLEDEQEELAEKLKQYNS